MILTCAHCSKRFEKPHIKGPTPKYCSGNCRQRALKRRRDRQRREQISRLADDMRIAHDSDDMDVLASLIDELDSEYGRREPEQ